MLKTADKKIRLALKEEFKKLDELHDKDKLMKNAARKLCWFIKTKISVDFELKSILVFIGPGNNGMDAFYMSKELVQSGFNVKLCIFKKSNLDLSGLDFFIYESSDRCKDEILKHSLIVDGIFGVGLSREVSDPYKSAIDDINQSLLPVLSVDVPSGLNSDTGKVLASAVLAQWTVSFGLSKPGFYMLDGPKAAGSVIVVDIGYSDIESVADSTFLFGPESAKNVFPIRDDLSNKSLNGRSCIVGGSSSMWGAAILASRAAFRVGSGYVMLYSFDDPSLVINDIPDVILGKIEKFEDIYSDDFVYVVGPGLGVDDRVCEFIKKLIGRAKNVVLDADALTVLAKFKLKSLPSSWLLTPHSAEMARLLDTTVFDVQRDRILAIKNCSSIYGCNVLLKGFRTLVFDTKRVNIVHSGNSALATAGTGDVLSGMIAGFVAQGVFISDAACLATYVHGRTADVWVRSGKSKNSMIASDILNLLPRVLLDLEV